MYDPAVIILYLCREWWDIADSCWMTTNNCHFSFELLKTDDIETRAPEGLMCQMLFMQDSRARVWRNW
jgi:hypothetical protein